MINQFRKGKKDEQVFVYQELSEKETFKLWLENDFWISFFEYEVQEQENSMVNIDDFYFTILLSLSNYMTSLKLPMTKINDIIIKELGHLYFTKSSKTCKELETTIKKQYENIENNKRSYL